MLLPLVIVLNLKCFFMCMFFRCLFLRFDVVALVSFIRFFRSSSCSFYHRVVCICVCLFDGERMSFKLNPNHTHMCTYRLYPLLDLCTHIRTTHTHIWMRTLVFLYFQMCAYERFVQFSQLAFWINLSITKFTSAQP